MENHTPTFKRRTVEKAPPAKAVFAWRVTCACGWTKEMRETKQWMRWMHRRHLAAIREEAAR